METLALDPNRPFFHEERQQSLTMVANTAITICGVGALGSNLADTLARMGFARLKLVDRDRVEMRNLSTQPFLWAEVGVPKARALAHTLYRAVRAKVEPVVAELTTKNCRELIKDSALVVDCFDNAESRQAVSAWAKRANVACLHLGFSPDGLYGSGIWEPGYVVPGDVPGDPCDYPLTRPFVLALVALGARAIVNHLVDGQQADFEVTWRDLAIRVERAG
jgi:hypothetical protein